MIVAMFFFLPKLWPSFEWVAKGKLETFLRLSPCVWIKSSIFAQNVIKILFIFYSSRVLCVCVFIFFSLPVSFAVAPLLITNRFVDWLVSVSNVTAVCVCLCYPFMIVCKKKKPATPRLFFFFFNLRIWKVEDCQHRKVKQLWHHHHIKNFSFVSLCISIYCNTHHFVTRRTHSHFDDRLP